MVTRTESMLMALEAELVSKMKKLAEEIIPLEGELRDVRRALIAVREGGPQERVSAADEFEPVNIDEFARYRSLSMKQLTLKALKEHFRDGATAQQLLAHFHDAYGRTDIVRSSLSPQLTRLKNSYKVAREGNIWKLYFQLKTPPEKEGVNLDSEFTAEEPALEGELFGQRQPRTPDRDPG